MSTVGFSGTRRDVKCAACERPFSPRSKPVWAFTKSGQPAGRVHTAPCVTGRARRLWTMGTEPLERAQFDLWLVYFRPRRESQTDGWYAEILADGPEQALTERQEQQLAWWVRRPTDPLPPERIAAIRDAHAALTQEYRDWLADRRRPRAGGATSDG